MKNIKKRRLAGAIAVIAILAICSLMLCSYIDSPDIPPDNDENGIAQPSERFIEQIEEDFLKYRGFGKNDTGIHIRKYYGVYNGDCVPFTARIDALFYVGAIRFTVAGELFDFADGADVIEVWKNGDIFTLEEAYEKGYLTAEQIADIADMHRNYDCIIFKKPSKVTESADDTDAPDTTFIYEELVPCVTES